MTIPSRQDQFTVYLITFMLTNQKYVGISSDYSNDIIKQFSLRNESRSLLIKDIKAYGYTSFKSEAIFTTTIETEANVKACELIIAYNSIFPFGYNINFPIGGYHDRYLLCHPVYLIKSIQLYTNMDELDLLCITNYNYKAKLFNINKHKGQESSQNIFHLSDLIAAIKQQMNICLNDPNHSLYQHASDLKTIFDKNNQLITLSVYLDIVKAFGLFNNIIPLQHYRKPSYTIIK